MIAVIEYRAVHRDFCNESAFMEGVRLLSLIKRSFSYVDYRSLVLECAEKNSTTGIDQTAERIAATKLNAQRMKRIDKQAVLHPEIISSLNKLNKKLEWIILSESWCGDGAQNIPIIAKMADTSPFIDLKIILRDENPEIMDAYVTGTTRAIPKLICIDTLKKVELGSWGSRPTQILKMAEKYKAQNPTVTHDEFVKNLHLWYAKDKGESLQQDFEPLLSTWIS